MDETLNITSFRNALEELERIHARAQTAAIQSDLEEFSIYRTAVVKGYEYAYILAIKFIERVIENFISEPVVPDDINFRDMPRIARENGLIRTIDSWLTYRDNRNPTAHGYQQSIADKIFAASPALIEDAHFTLAAIERRMKAGS